MFASDVAKETVGGMSFRLQEMVSFIGSINSVDCARGVLLGLTWPPALRPRMNLLNVFVLHAMRHHIPQCRHRSRHTYDIPTL